MGRTRTKPTFGSMATCKVRYVIAVMFTDNTYKYVTHVHVEPHKYCEWLDGEKAYFFSDRVSAEDVCLGLNVNGTGCFVMEVPDWFDESNFINSKSKKEE